MGIAPLCGILLPPANVGNLPYAAGMKTGPNSRTSQKYRALMLSHGWGFLHLVGIQMRIVGWDCSERVLIQWL